MTNASRHVGAKDAPQLQSAPAARRQADQASRRGALVCRRMSDADIDAAIVLLTRGFPERAASYWVHALERLRTRILPEELPRYGYVLADGEKLVGIVLAIFGQSDAGEVRANVSSWYVEPSHRGYSHMLLAALLRLKDVTFFNISPAPQTFETITAQGFSPYVDGTFVAFAAASAPVQGASVRRIPPGDETSAPLLRDHAGWGDLSFEVTYEGEVHPFVFVGRRFAGGRIPCAQLIYCRSIDSFVRFAGPLGRALLRHGLGTVMIDANGPIKGLTGIYRSGRSRKFFKGMTPPRLGDLSYTELAIFGS